MSEVKQLLFRWPPRGADSSLELLAGGLNTQPDATHPGWIQLWSVTVLLQGSISRVKGSSKTSTSGGPQNHSLSSLSSVGMLEIHV